MPGFEAHLRINVPWRCYVKPAGSHKVGFCNSGWAADELPRWNSIFCFDEKKFLLESGAAT